MNITLTGFAEEVPVTDLKSVNRFLVFENENKEQLRIPVGQEAIAAVAKFLMRSPAAQEEVREEVQEEEAPPEDEQPEGAQVFGGDEEPGPDQDDLQGFQLPESPSDDTVPDDGVQSL